MKILYFITGLKKGGAENQLYNLLSKLSVDKDYEFKIISLFSGPHKIEIEKLNIEVEIYTGKSSLFNIISIINFYRREVIKFKPDIVHSFLFHTNIISKISLFFMKKNFKLICSYRSVIKKLFLIKYLEYINMSKVDMTISNSYAADLDLEIYRYYNLDRKVINNSFNGRLLNFELIETLKNKYLHKKIILTVANFRKEKDFTTNLLTCKELTKKRDDFLFLYVGSPGPEIEVINNLKKKLELDGKVEVLGIRDDVFELLELSDVFFMPTEFESQSNSIMEAMYMKKPIVTTNVLGNKELLKKGFLCEVKDYKIMAKKINLILEGRYDNSWLDINSNILKSNYSMDNMAMEYRKVYKKLYLDFIYEKK